MGVFWGFGPSEHQNFCQIWTDSGYFGLTSPNLAKKIFKNDFKPPKTAIFSFFEVFLRLNNKNSLKKSVKFIYLHIIFSCESESVKKNLKKCQEILKMGVFLVFLVIFENFRCFFGFWTFRTPKLLPNLNWLRVFWPYESKSGKKKFQKWLR